MSAKVRWGVLGVAKIATKKVIPAMQLGQRSEVTAIASREGQKAQAAAKELGLSKSYGSYEELINDPDIDAIYNPLLNHLHVSWSIKAAEAGKHVLCEKPIALTVAETKTLIDARDRTGVKIGEAFMVKTHPQWLRAREIVRSGKLGELRAIMCEFSYFNNDPRNIRNVPEYGGGGLMDVGCYPITTSRFLFGREPVRVVGLIDRDAQMGTDHLASAMLDFAPGQAVFTCSTQLVPYQRMQILGTNARLDIEIPFNAPPDKPTRIFVDDGSALDGSSAVPEELATVDQYTVQGDAFSRAIQEDGEVPVPLEDALRNMMVIEGVFESAKTGCWVKLG